MNESTSARKKNAAAAITMLQNKYAQKYPFVYSRSYIFDDHLQSSWSRISVRS